MTVKNGMTRLGSALAFVALVAAPAHAQQQVVLTGSGDVLTDHRLERLLRSGDYVVAAADTFIAAGDTVRRTLLVLDSEVVVEGTILGDLVAIDADVFLRPGAVVKGDVLNLGGGLYASELIEVSGRTVDRPRALYSVERESGRVVIVADRHDAAFRPDGVMGVHVPRYNRVDGLAVDVGASYRFLRIGEVEGTLHGQIGYRTDRGDLAGGASLLLERRAWELEGGWMRETASNDRWIRGDLRNSLDFIWDGDDMRNYHETSTGFAEVRRWFGSPDDTRHLVVALRAQQEQAKTLRAGAPWSVLGYDSVRPNPVIDDGMTRSLIPSFAFEWLATRTAAEGLVELEIAETQLDAFLGDAAFAPRDGGFTRLRVGGEWAMAALFNHTLEIEGQFVAPLAGEGPLPRQRWAMLGGSSTIRTLENGELWGDHLAYVKTEYSIPMPRLRVPYLGVPELQLLHSGGLAWTGERTGDFVHNIGARIELFMVYARYIVDPASDESEFSIGFSWPFDDEYPWQREQAEPGLAEEVRGRLGL